MDSDGCHISAEAMSASRLAYICLIIAIVAFVSVLAFPISIPLSITGLLLSRKAKRLESIDAVAKSVAKVAFVVSIVALVIALLVPAFMMVRLPGVQTTPGLVVESVETHDLRP